MAQQAPETKQPGESNPRLTRWHAQPSGGQYCAAVVGAFYVVLGLLGFAVTGGQGWTGADPTWNVASVGVNPLLNLVHLLLGVAGLAAYLKAGTARLYGLLLLVAGGALFAYGLLVSPGSSADVLHTSDPGTVLHAATAVAGLLIAALPTGRGRADSGKGER
ncbi:DUF4383 domain-containing protein [Kineococcus sp. SYSU DK004]|uniref:DUF4383 domain-containing protein n=1 Tax=Kineococcus sp. SYSU DK004 TaxID=3383125 RepID=UPI003D7D2E10